MGTSPPGPRIPKPQRIGGATSRSAIDMGLSGPLGATGGVPSGQTERVFDEQGVGGMGPIDDDRGPAEDGEMEARLLRLEGQVMARLLSVERRLADLDGGLALLLARSAQPAPRASLRSRPSGHQ